MLPSSSFGDGITTLHSSLLVTFFRPFPVSTASLTPMVLYSLMPSLNSFLTVWHISAYSIFVRGIVFSFSSAYFCLILKLFVLLFSVPSCSSPSRPEPAWWASWFNPTRHGKGHYETAVSPRQPQGGALDTAGRHTEHILNSI